MSIEVLDDRVTIRGSGSGLISPAERLTALKMATLRGKPLEVRSADALCGQVRMWSMLARSEGMTVRWEFPDAPYVAFGFVHASDRSAVTS